MKLHCQVGSYSRLFVGAALVLVTLSGCELLMHKQVETVSTVGGQGADPAIVQPTVTDPRSLGRYDAPVVIIEYSDYQCPYCGKFHLDVLPSLQREYIDTGKLRLIFRDLPLDMHRESVPAAIAANCAAEQGKFWAMNEALFADQHSLGAQMYEQLAESLKLDMDKFRACVQNPFVRKKVQAGTQEAQRYSLNATPSFILGRSVHGKIEIHSTARGYVDFATFSREINSLLASTSAQGKAPTPIQ